LFATLEAAASTRRGTAACFPAIQAPNPSETVTSLPAALWVPKTPSKGCDLQVRGAAEGRLTDTPGWSVVLRLPYLALTSVFAFIRLLPMSDTDKDIEILALRHRAPRGAMNRVG
jgi:hypothetical protein